MFLALDGSPDHNDIRDHIMQAALVSGEKRDKKEWWKQPGYIKQYGMRRSLQKRGGSAFHAAHFEVHKDHAGRAHARTRNRQAIIKKRDDWEQRRQYDG